MAKKALWIVETLQRIEDTLTKIELIGFDESAGSQHILLYESDQYMYIKTEEFTRFRFAD